MEKQFMGIWVTLQSAALLLSVSTTLLAAMPEPERLATEIEKFAQGDAQNHWPEARSWLQGAPVCACGVSIS